MTRIRGMRAAGVALGFVLSVQLAIPQAKPPGGTPGGTPAPSPSPSPTPNTPTPNTRTTSIPSPQMPEIQRPIFLSGRVVLDDGSAPPEPVMIERICNGVPRPEAYTDSKGHFSFELGRNTQMLADASTGSEVLRTGQGNPFGTTGQRSRTLEGGSDQRLAGCDLSARLAGFRAETVNLTGRRFMDNPDVGTIVLHRLANVEGSTISMTSLEAPKDARKAYEKGMEALNKHKWAEAQKQFEKAVAQYPKYAAAWWGLGSAYENQKNLEEARKAYKQSIEADPKFVKPYLRMAEMAFEEQKWQDLADASDRVTHLDPVDFPKAWVMNAIANFNLHNLDAAERSAREALKLDERHTMPKIEHILGVILAGKRQYAAAAQYMRSYLERAPNASDADVVRKQVTDLDRLSGGKQ